MAAQTITNMGTGGSDLNGQAGSTTAADSNDPTFLAWSGTNYLYFATGNANFLTVADPGLPTGDIDIRVKVAWDDWTPASIGCYFHQSGAANNSVILLQNTDGKPELRWSADGTTVIQKPATAGISAADGDTLWVRATLDVDNGAGGNDVKYYTSTDDGTTWVQLGATVTTAGTTSIFDSTATIMVSNYFGTTLNGKLYRLQILNGIGGSVVLDVDSSLITSGSATSFAARVGGTVTIARATSGPKMAAVVSPVWLFGTDDYIKVSDNTLLDFGATDSFSIVAVVRQWNTPTSFGKYVNKGTSPAYYLDTDSATLTPRGVVIDVSSNFGVPTGPTMTAGALSVLVAVVNRSTNQMTTYTNGVAGTPASISTVGTLVNSSDLYIGSSGGATYQDCEVIAAAVFRRALTATEVSQISTYYSARLS